MLRRYVALARHGAPPGTLRVTPLAPALVQDRASDEEARRRSAQVEHYTKVHDGLKQKYTGTGSGGGGHPK